MLFREKMLIFTFISLTVMIGLLAYQKQGLKTDLVIANAKITSLEEAIKTTKDSETICQVQETAVDQSCKDKETRDQEIKTTTEKTHADLEKLYNDAKAKIAASAAAKPVPVTCNNGGQTVGVPQPPIETPEEQLVRYMDTPVPHDIEQLLLVRAGQGSVPKN